MSENKHDQFFLYYAGLSDIGMIRLENQDSFGKFPVNDLDLYSGKGQLFVVADGVGGHKGGKEASSMAVSIIEEIFLNSISTDKTSFLKKAIEEANQRIYSRAKDSAELMGMATTCSVLFLKEDHGIIAHVGDSRVYKIENNNIEQLTSDHTHVEEMLRQGIISSKDANNSLSKSVLARAVGVEEKVKVDIIENIRLKKDQSFVLCSDGLGKVSLEEIKEIVKNNSAGVSCEKLISIANERGGKDNVTVIVINISSVDKDAQKNPHEAPPKSRNKLSFLIMGFILVTLLSLGVIFRNHLLPSGLDNVLNEKKGSSGQIENKTVTLPQAEHSGKELLEKAVQLQNRGKMESALAVYKKILADEPMNLAALNGINKIAEWFFQKAENLRKSNDFKGALNYYYKVIEIQPDNEKSNYYISLYRNRDIPSKAGTVDTSRLQ